MSLSLRSFHLFFIAVSVLLAAWVGVWGFQSYQATRNPFELALAVLSFGAGCALAVYWIRVRKKLRALEPED